MICWLVIFLFHVSTYPYALAYWCCVLVHQFEREVPPHAFSCVRAVEGEWKVQIEFEERGSEIWVMMRTWDKSTFRRVCVTMLSRFSTNTTLEATILGKILGAAGRDASVVSLHAGPHVLVEAFARILGSGYRTKLVEYPKFDLRLMKRCLQQTAASVFESTGD